MKSFINLFILFTSSFRCSIDSYLLLTTWCGPRRGNQRFVRHWGIQAGGDQLLLVNSSRTRQSMDCVFVVCGSHQWTKVGANCCIRPATFQSKSFKKLVPQNNFCSKTNNKKSQTFTPQKIIQQLAANAIIVDLSNN